MTFMTTPNPNPLFDVIFQEHTFSFWYILFFFICKLNPVFYIEMD